MNMGQQSAEIIAKYTIEGYMQTFEALVSIGFKPAQAKAAVQKLPQEIATVEEAVKAALKTS